MVCRRLVPGFRRFRGRFRRFFLREESGVVAILWALTVPVLLGFIALGVETSVWYTTRQALQASADAAAMAAALELAAGNAAGYVDVGVYEAKRNGLDPSAKVVVGHPTSGTHVADPKAAEAVISQDVKSLIAGWFLSGVTISVRAVATTVDDGSTAGVGCILTLNKTDAKTFHANGSPDLKMSTCDVYNNSSNDSAAYVWGSAEVRLHSLNVVGNYKTGPSAHLYGAIHTGVTAMADPYLSLPTPAVGNCLYNNTMVTGSGVQPALSQGVYCGGLHIGGSTTVTLNPGVYIINGDHFTIDGSTTVTGHGVTIFLTGGTAATCATSTINGSSTVTLSAPTTDTYKGILIFQDRKCANTGPGFNGSATLKLTGVIYMPTQKLTYSGSSNSGEGYCTQLVVDTVDFSGSADVSSACGGTGVTPLGSVTKTKVSFVE
ncbi:MAG: TadE/TadG family type IV pilus assembly protein [Alphaproteobacteria bacterium]